MLEKDEREVYLNVAVSNGVIVEVNGFLTSKDRDKNFHDLAREYDWSNGDDLKKFDLDFSEEKTEIRENFTVYEKILLPKMPATRQYYIALVKNRSRSEVDSYGVVKLDIDYKKYKSIACWDDEWFESYDEAHEHFIACFYHVNPKNVKRK